MHSYSHQDLVFKETTTVLGSLSSKKKYTPMKEALNSFYSYMDQNKKQNPLRIPREEVQKLLRPAQYYKSAKFHIALLGFLIKMINLNVIHDIITFHDILDYFLVVKDIPKDNLQVKIQQSFMNLIHSDYINFANLSFVEKCFTMALFMKSSKLQIISSTADAAVVQIIQFLSISTQLIIIDDASNSFDELTLEVDLNKDNTPNEQLENQKTQQLKPALSQGKQEQLNNLTKLITDLCLVSDFKKPLWYPPTIQIDREIGLSAINSLLRNMGKFFQAYEQVDNLIRNTLFPVIRKTLFISSHMIKSSIVVECFKCVVNLIEMSPMGYMELWKFLEAQIKMPEQYIHRNLAFQSILYFTENQIFLDCLSRDKTNYFLEILNLFSQLAKDTPQPTEMEAKRWVDFTNPTANLQGESAMDIMPSDNYFIIRMLSEFTQRLTHSLAVMAEHSIGVLGTRVRSIKSTQMVAFMNLVEKISRPLLRTIRHLLDKEMEEGVTQSVLNAVQGLVNITGSVQLRQCQEGLIKVICEFCLPKQGQPEFTKRHIQINKMVLNIGNCLGNLLECSCWINILKTFQECENFYQRNRLARDGSQEEQIKSQDILILFASLDQLFSHSANYDNEHLLLIMDAINQITIDQLEFNQYEMNQMSPHKQDSQRTRIFSLTKLLELVRPNLHRLDLFWELIMAHFISVMSSRNVFMMNNAADTLCQIIFLGFDFLLQNRQNEQPETLSQTFVKEKWFSKDGAYQHTLLQPLVDLCALRSAELKETILQAILRIIQNNGHELKSLGWEQVLMVLRQISSEQTHLYVKSGLTATECIINQFLGGLNSSQMEQLFEVIENFQQNSSESNINFQICNMLWHIGDFLNKSNQETHNQFIIKIFKRLSQISLDMVPEIRHSAIHIFANLLLHLNTRELKMGGPNHQQNAINSPDEWQGILENSFFQMTERIIQQFQDKRIANEQDASSWEETVKSVLQSALKLIKKYFSIIEEQPTISQSEKTQYILDLFLPLLVQAMKQYRGELLLECFRVAKELIQCKPQEHFLVETSFRELLNFLERLFTSPPHDIKLLKITILKVIPETILFLEQAFKSCLEHKSFITTLFNIYQMLLSYPLIADMTFNLVQNKIFYDDTNAINLLRVFNPLIPQLSEESYDCLLQTMRKTLESQPTSKAQHSLLLKLIRQLESLLSQAGWMERPYFELLEEITKTALLLRANSTYINFHLALGGQSVWAQACFSILNICKVSETKKNRLCTIVQSLIPNTTHFTSNHSNDSVLYLNENIQVQNQCIEFLAHTYTKNQDLVNKQFYMSLYELTTIKCNNSFLIGECPLKTIILLQKSYLSNQCLPFVIAISQKLIENQLVQKSSEPTSKLFMLLLQSLRDLEIPKQSFHDFKSIFNERHQNYDENSLVQSEKGHLCYLMPQIIQCIASNDIEIRKLTQSILSMISEFVVKEQQQ